MRPLVLCETVRRGPPLDKLPLACEIFVLAAGAGPV
jgi:hypothetical protein